MRSQLQRKHHFYIVTRDEYRKVKINITRDQYQYENQQQIESSWCICQYACLCFVSRCIVVLQILYKLLLFFSKTEWMYIEIDTSIHFGCHIS
jgi:hypothetical protein